MNKKLFKNKKTIYISPPYNTFALSEILPILKFMLVNKNTMW